jgi:hypothetical protein
MYARAVERRNADGSTTRYVQLAVTERRDGVPRARVVHNFGREDRLDRHMIRRLVRSLSRFLPPTAPFPQERRRNVEFVEAEQAVVRGAIQEQIRTVERGQWPTAQWEEDEEFAALRSALAKLDDAYDGGP